ncbi:MAG: preprotein translocase subunit YajC [Pseudomonadales bacterium]|jgi:preprotein translocase subunit YajC|nr:preprotein translocase subunit YajC [Pseudomonadales bacterium]
MSILLAEAWAADAGASPSAGLLEFLPLVLLFVIFYFFLIRPQQKRQKEHQALIGGLSKGDEIVTSGGVVAAITRVEEDFVVARVAAGTELRFQKPAVVATLPKGTLKKLDAEKD